MTSPRSLCWYSRRMGMLNIIVLCHAAIAGTPGVQSLDLQPGDRVAIVGNTYAERMHMDGQFESLLHAAYPGHQVSVRNFGWSGDEVALQPRPLNFFGMDEWLDLHDTDVLIACFGMNESYAGDDGLVGFRKDLETWISDHQARKYNGESAPRIVLVSPIAHEELGEPLPDGREHNFVLRRYVDVMRQVALAHDVMFVDLFTPTFESMARNEGPLTINGIHPNARGFRITTCALADQLGLVTDQGDIDEEGTALQQHEALRQAVLAKNRLFFQRWRPVNTEYVYGRRHEPYGSQNFPDEMKQLDRLIDEADRGIWSMPPGRSACIVVEEDY